MLYELSHILMTDTILEEIRAQLVIQNTHLDSLNTTVKFIYPISIIFLILLFIISSIQLVVYFVQLTSWLINLRERLSRREEI